MNAQRFGKALADALAARDWSQRQFAAHYGVTPATISRWCLAQTVPDPPTVFDLERALDLVPGSLSHHLGYLPDVAERRQKADVVAAITADRALDERAREVLLAAYRALAE